MTTKRCEDTDEDKATTTTMMRANEASDLAYDSPSSSWKDEWSFSEAFHRRRVKSDANEKVKGKEKTSERARRRGRSESQRKECVEELSGMSALPRDVCVHVCSFMDARAVESLGLTSRSFRAMTMEDDELWRGLFEKRWRWRPGRVWARSAQLPFTSPRATNAERPDFFRGGCGWREAFKARYGTRGVIAASVPGHVRRVHRVDCVGGSIESSALQRVLNSTTVGDVVILSPGTYKGGITMPHGIELVGDGKRKQIIIVSDDKAALKTKTKMKVKRGLPSLVTNVTLFRQSATSRGTLSGDTHQACVYVSRGTTLRIDSCDIISAGEGIAATCGVVHAHASNIHSVLSSFLSGAGSSLTACRITAATSDVDDSTSDGTSEDEFDVGRRNSGFAHLFAAVTALSGEVRIENNRIINGFAHGVVLFNSAHGQIHDNLIANNIGAGISVGASSTANITNTIVANNASVGIAMCGRGVISHSDIRGNMFNGIDVSQSYTTRDYFNAHEDDIDEERDVEEEFSAFLLGVDVQEEHSTSSIQETDVTIVACAVHNNANDGICVTGGAKVNLRNGCELFANAGSDLAIDRGRVRWTSLSIAGRRVDAFTDDDEENRARTVRVLGSLSSLTPMLFGVSRSRSTSSIHATSTQNFHSLGIARA